MKIAVLMCSLACLAARAAVAQDVVEQDPAETARFRAGPLRFTPWIALTNLGVDSNVFNDVSDPKRDSTAAFGPGADLWLRVGRTRMSGNVSAQYLYFKNFDTQRGWSTIDSLKWEVPLARLTPYVAVDYANTKQRSGFEVDSRARQRRIGGTLGTRLRFSDRSEIIASVIRSQLEFAADERFLDVDLADALNHRSDGGALEFRYQLTPLTTLVVNSTRVQDRFTRDPLRNADRLRVAPGFEFNPFAIISGSVFVGYERFTPRNPTVPSKQGLTAAVDTSYSHGSTQIGLKVGRDFVYSVEQDTPFYVATQIGASITQRITRTWDFVLRSESKRLSYQAVESAEYSAARVDRSYRNGAGIGYRVGQTLRMGLDADYERRRSPVSATRDYDGFRFGGSLTYGLPQ